MTRIFYFLIVLVLFSCSGKEEKNTQESSAIPETITAEEFREKINSVDNAILLDVRTPEEVERGYIEGALNINFRATDFESRIDSLDKGATYLVYCGSGGRSRKTADIMKAHQFEKVYDLKGGFGEWTSKGLPTKVPQ